MLHTIQMMGITCYWLHLPTPTIASDPTFWHGLPYCRHQAHAEPRSLRHTGHRVSHGLTSPSTSIQHEYCQIWWSRIIQNGCAVCRVVLISFMLLSHFTLHNKLMHTWTKQSVPNEDDMKRSHFWISMDYRAMVKFNLAFY